MGGVSAAVNDAILVIIFGSGEPDCVKASVAIVEKKLFRPGGVVSWRSGN